MRSFLLFSGFLCLMSLAAFSQQGEEDRSLSPYFLVKSDSGQVDQMPLKHSSAEVHIAGVIAEVLVTQVYQNEGKLPLEATYIFPASTRAAVFAMEMRVGQRRIKAQIKEREAARQLYEAAKEQGKTASLLEQERPNIFSMNIANILPGDSIVVKLSYTELLKPEKGVYEFVYPTVVGPRYTGPQGDPAPQAVIPASQPQPEKGEIPYTPEGEAPGYTFGLEATISGGMPVQRVISPSHNIEVDFSRGDVAKIKLDESEWKGGNRDFVMRYRLSGEDIQPGLLTYEENGEKFFLLMVQPPQLLAPEKIPPREYIFVVDVSGSMNGFPLNTAKLLMHDLLKNLRPMDRFNVILFEYNKQVYAPNSVQATPENIEEATDFMLSTRGGGGTNLYNGIQAALDMEGTSGFSRNIVAVTDGYISAEASVFDLIRNSLGEANFWSFGIGSSVNRFLIEGLAYVGKGEPLIVMNSLEVKSSAQKFREYIEMPALTNVKVDFGLSDVYEVEPGFIPDVMAERPILIMGKYRGELDGQWQISGLSGQENWLAVVPMGEGVRPKRRNRALRYLWARERIRLLGDYEQFGSDSARVAEITQLGLDYNLLTKYTSFVAVDDRIRNKTGQDSAVTQPLPLPEGVSNKAVGGNLQILPPRTPATQMQGSRSATSVYYIDGQKVRGALQELSLDEVSIMGGSVSIQPENATGYSINLSENHSFLNSHQFNSLILGGASGIQNGEGAIYVNGVPLFMGLGNYYHLQQLPYFWANNATLLVAGSSQTQGHEAIYGGLSLGMWDSYKNTFEAEVKGDALADMSMSLKGKYKLNEKISTRLFVNGNDFQRTIDRNDDGFKDADSRRHIKLMNMWEGAHSAQKLKWNGAIYFHQEERDGGQYENKISPSAELFTWDWQSRHFGAFGNAVWDFGKNHSLSFKTIFQNNQNNGGWGAKLYLGTQRHFESQLSYQKEMDFTRYRLQIGGGLMYRNTATQESFEAILLKRNESVPAGIIYAKLMEINNNFSLTGELRSDHHNLYGLLLHPKLAAKYENENMLKGRLRITASVYRGTRAANLLSENLRYMPSNRVWQDTVSDFVPDQGWKYNLSGGYSYENNKLFLALSASYTYSHYNSMMLAEVENRELPIRFYPSETDVVRHQAIGLFELRLWNKIGLKAHYFFDDFKMLFEYRNNFTPKPFNARHRGYLTLYYQSKYKNGLRPWTASVTTLYAGKQFVPYKIPPWQRWSPYSRSYLTLSAELRREFNRFYLFAGVDNLTDYRQNQLVIAPEATESAEFDASLVWGPTLGRRIYGGIGISLTE